MYVLFDELEKLGINVSKTLPRFMGDENFYKKFLKKFADDFNIGELKKELDEADFDASIVTVHTLKGITANLGIESLYVIANDMLNCLRSGDMEKARVLFFELEDEYKIIAKVIKAY